MSLTNPKDVIIEERLKDFYDAIYPYLGGMPEVLANKFSRGDIYSTTEKMIGQWSDGKPIYQKTFNVTIPTPSSDGTQASVEYNIGASVDTVVSCIGMTKDSTMCLPIPAYREANRWWYAMVWNNSATTANKLVIRNYYAALGGKTAYVTVQYTKTTDSAISIGVDTDYSTTEKIVGTWIDGKYIYQKSFSFTMSATSTNGTEVDNFIDVGAQVDKFISFQGIATTSAGYHDFPSIYTNGGYVRVMGYHNSTSITENKNKINVKNAWTNVNNNPAWLTVQYTKTS